MLEATVDTYETLLTDTSARNEQRFSSARWHTDLLLVYMRKLEKELILAGFEDLPEIPDVEPQKEKEQNGRPDF